MLQVPALFNARKRVADLATALGLPIMLWGDATDADGVFCYCTSFADTSPACRA